MEMKEPLHYCETFDTILNHINGSKNQVKFLMESLLESQNSGSGMHYVSVCLHIFATSIVMLDPYMAKTESKIKCDSSHTIVLDFSHYMKSSSLI